MNNYNSLGFVENAKGKSAKMATSLSMPKCSNLTLDYYIMAYLYEIYLIHCKNALICIVFR